MFIYSLFDKIANFYEPPIAFPSDHEALRRITRDFVMFKISWYMIPNFDFYCIGSFDPNTGKVESCVPRLIDDFHNFVMKGLENVKDS